MKNFIEFVREQGVVGLAVGFILGGSMSRLVSSAVNDILNPVLSLVVGSVGNLKDAYWTVGKAKITYGNFLNTALDFALLSLVVYITIKKLKLDRLDKKKA